MAFSKVDARSVSGAVSGRKNLIINGAMQVAQRGTSFTTADGYTLDRFHFLRGSSTAAHTVTQSTDAPDGFQYSLKTEVTTAESSGTTNYTSLYYACEGYDVAHLQQGTSNVQNVILSFWVKSSLTGTFGLGLQNAATDRAYLNEYVINTANTWEKKTIQLTLDTSGTWNTTNGIGLRLNWDLGVGTNQSISAGSWVSSNQIGLTDGVKLTETTGATFHLTGVQLEVGDTATDFEHRSFGEELALCQRYFEKSFNYSVAPQEGVTTNIMYGQSGKVSYFVPKRTAPTLTSYSTAVWNQTGYWSYYTGSTFVHAIPTLYSSERMLTWYMGGYTYADLYGNWTADAEL